jgi:hypothetical protein|tara:strand:- start:6672 stop:7403 length:732 start_codon:yes stop_codon:yes gene_type:complete
MKTELQTAILSGAMALGTAACAQSVADPAQEAIDPAFDIVEMGATSDGRLLTFAMAVAGRAGSVKPVPIGQLAGAKVQAYVWPTNMDPARVGFDPESGILALAITAHPDFDDTPLFDEDQDGDPANDGANWHSHWVVLVEDTACGAGLKVRDVSPGRDILPATAPHLPIALDSPGMSPILDGSTARITVPIADTEGVSFDAVTAELQVNSQGEAPLLCVTGIHDVMSGDLSLPGRVIVEHSGH